MAEALTEASKAKFKIFCDSFFLFLMMHTAKKCLKVFCLHMTYGFKVELGCEKTGFFFFV